MANYYASARSNYVKITDFDALRKALAPFSVTLSADKRWGYYCFLCNNDSGFTSTFDEWGNELEWSPHVFMPYIEEGQVLILMECGAEKLRYLNGYAEAYCKRGGKILESFIGLERIYIQAAEDFGVSEENISRAEY